MGPFEDAAARYGLVVRRYHRVLTTIAVAATSAKPPGYRRLDCEELLIL
jgi:hypothetical protein